MKSIKSFFAKFLDAIYTLFGLNHQETVDKAYNSISKEEREAIEGLVNSVFK